MHAIAWAGAERQPPEPTARMLLNDFGLNEQTLMVSGTEEKVRNYLETLLAEDRSLLERRTHHAEVGARCGDTVDRGLGGVRDSRLARRQPPIVTTTELVVLDAMKPVVRQDLKDLKLRADSRRPSTKRRTWPRGWPRRSSCAMRCANTRRSAPTAPSTRRWATWRPSSCK
jgi:hypothetical protein